MRSISTFGKTCKAVSKSGVLVFGLLLGTAVTLPAQSQACIDNAVTACFDGCTNPLNLQECIIGCSAGGTTDVSNCSSNCFGDTFCQNQCVATVRAIAVCPFVTGEVKAVSGAIVLNRATGVWQQVVLITNTSTTDAFDKLCLVLDSLAPGWTLLNGDGLTNVLLPAGTPYKNFGPLAPGASMTVTLQFSRTVSSPATPAFGYVTRVVVGPTR